MDKKTFPPTREEKIVPEQTEVLESAQILEQDDTFKIALVFPSKIVGKYAKDTINTLTAYMLHHNIKFSFEVFDSNVQNIENIKTTFTRVYEKGYSNVIVLYTPEALDNLFSINEINNFNIYLPLIHKNESKHELTNVVYGGIDYKAQIKKLFTLSNKANSIFYSDTTLGLKLKSYVEELSQNINVSTKINQRSNEFKKIVREKGIKNSSLFLNTPIIKSSILLSQLRAYDTVPYIILSTQLNYTPLVISLTQYPDRKKFIVANSIEKINLKLQESLSLLGVDVAYNWVNYSSLIGIDSLFTKKQSKLFPNKIIDNQVQYGITLHKNTRHGFKELR